MLGCGVTTTRIVDFLSLLGLLSPAEQFLICFIERSIQTLHDEIVQAREEEGAAAADKIVVLRAKITYSCTIQSDFLQEVLDISLQPRNQRGRRGQQQRRNREGAILTTITNTQCLHYQPRRNNQNDPHTPTQSNCEDYGQQMGDNPPPYNRQPAHTHQRRGRVD